MSINTNDYANQLLAENESLKLERDELRGKVKKFESYRSIKSKLFTAVLDRAKNAEAELARRDAVAGEPFAYIDSSHLDEFGWGYVFKQLSPMRAGCKFPVYAAAPPAVLPPEMTIDRMDCELTDFGKAISCAGYNQCRADAMALGAHQQKVVELPAPEKDGGTDWQGDITAGCVNRMRDKCIAALDAANVKWEVKK